MSAPFDHLDQITDWLKATDIEVFELCGRDGGVRLSRRVDGTFERLDLPAGFQPQRSEGVILSSPGVGSFLYAHPLQARPQHASVPASGEGRSSASCGSA